MKKTRKTYNFFQLASAVFMILALLWLTISIPFVYASKQQLAKHEKSAMADVPLPGNDEDTNPFGNTTEEKCPNNTFSEEYLHDAHGVAHFFSAALQHHKYENAGTYIAFHGELLVPPPNIA